VTDPELIVKKLAFVESCVLEFAASARRRLE
jgi:hypothetical protein